MPEKIEELVRAALAAAQEAGDLSAFELDDCAIERPADTSHGEWTSTMALKSAKLAHCAPRKIAEAIVAHMPEDPASEKVGMTISAIESMNMFFRPNLSPK